MSPKIEAVVKALKNRPLTSNQLNSALVGSSVSSSPDAARKLVQRAKLAGAILSTSPVRFDKQYLYFLESHPRKKYSDAVRQLMETEKPAYARVFKTLLANQGWITQGQIGKASAALPSDAQAGASKRKNLDQVVVELKHLGFLEQTASESEEGIYKIGSRFGVPKVSRRAFMYYLAIDHQMLSQSQTWLSSSYLVSHDAKKMRNSPVSAVELNGTLWDLGGPMYLGPASKDPRLRRTFCTENFLVVDFLCYRSFGIVDADSVIDRLERVLFRWRKIALTPVVIARFFSKDAHRKLRSAGIATVLIADVFGKNVDELLRTIWNSIKRFERTAELARIEDIEKSLALADSVVEQDGLVGNLKGIIFEFIVAMAYKSAGFDVTFHKSLRNAAGDEFEIDIVAIRGDECRLVECKGHGLNVPADEDEVKRHFVDRISAAADPYGWNVTSLYSKVVGEFVTSSQLDAGANAFCKKTKKSHGVACEVQERSGLVKWLNQLRLGEIVEILDKYYSGPQG